MKKMGRNKNRDLILTSGRDVCKIIDPLTIEKYVKKRVMHLFVIGNNKKVVNLENLALYTKIQRIRFNSCNFDYKLSSTFFHDSITHIVLDEFTGLDSLNFLSNLKALRSLMVSSPEQQMDISFLKDCKTIKELVIHKFYHPSDLSPLLENKTIKYLTITSCSLYDLSIIGTMTNLKHLNLRHNFIENINPLEGLSKLQLLDLAHNAITDVHFLFDVHKFPVLERLYLDHNKIDNISAIYRNYVVCHFSITSNRVGEEIQKVLEHISLNLFNQHRRNCTLFSKVYSHVDTIGMISWWSYKIYHNQKCSTNYGGRDYYRCENFGCTKYEEEERQEDQQNTMKSFTMDFSY